MSNAAFSSKTEREYTGKDQDWENESTTYWFETDFGIFGVEESGSDSVTVNQDGSRSEDLSVWLLMADAVTDEMRAE